MQEACMIKITLFFIISRLPISVHPATILLFQVAVVPLSFESLLKLPSCLPHVHVSCLNIILHSNCKATPVA